MKIPERFHQLEKELDPYLESLAEASEKVREQEVSDYPIFVVHQQTVEVGIPLFRREKVRGNWSINVSSMEEFVAKQLISAESIDHFISIYKDPDDFLCLFVISELGAQFVFIPKVSGA